MTNLEIGTIWQHSSHSFTWVTTGPNRTRRLDDPTQKNLNGPNEAPYTIIGRLPPDQLNATKWKDGYKLPQPALDRPDEVGVKWFEETHCWGWYEKEPDSKPGARAESITDEQKQLLDIHFQWQDKLQDWTQKHATGKMGRDLVDAVIETADALKVENAKCVRMQALANDNYNSIKKGEKAERARAEGAIDRISKERDRALDNYGRTKNDLDHKTSAYERVLVAFRAATGADHDPNLDYSQEKDWKKCYEAARHRELYNDRVNKKLKEEAAARDWLESNPFKKGHRMSIFTPFKLLAKPAMYTAIAALCLNLNTIKDYTVEWWSAPTTLELGDWTRVRSCDSCNAVAKDTPVGFSAPQNDPLSVKHINWMCPKCGGETFTERKAQRLFHTSWLHPYPALQAGYIFQDGTDTITPGNWVIPERG